MPKITLTGYQCNACGHRWAPRNDEKPLCCAKCKTPYWDRPRTKKVKNQ